MNGGTGSTLPARNPNSIPRPVTFHSLSEHNRNNPTYLSPHSHRRPRTPRSSPLAGPSLSSSEDDAEKKVGEEGQKPRYRPNRISSTPDMADLYGSDVALFPSPPSITSIGSTGVVVSPPAPNSSNSSSSGEDDKDRELTKGGEEADDGNILLNLAKRLSIISTLSLTTSETDKDASRAGKQRSSFLLHSTSTTSLASTSSSRTARTDMSSQTAPPMPTIPPWALNAMREEAGVASRNAKYGHRRGTSGDLTSSSSLPPLPNQPIPRGTPLSASALSNQPRPPSMSRDPSVNWVSMSDPVPRFSRLSLKGEGVVLPLTKKETLAKMRSSSSIKSSRSTTSISQAATTRRSTETLTRAGFSSGTDENESQNVTITGASSKETGLRRRSMSAGSFRAKIRRSSVSSLTDRENVSPLSFPIGQSGSGLASVSNLPTSTPSSNDSVSNRTVTFPSIGVTPHPRRSTASRRDSDLAAIDELPSPLPNDSEVVMKVDDKKPRITKESRERRKSIKQIVMRITTAPIHAGEKLKFGMIHKSGPVVVLPPDTLSPLDPPPTKWFGGLASSSVPSLPSTKETSEFARGQGDALSGKRFKSIKKRWNTVLAAVRR